MDENQTFAAALDLGKRHDFGGAIRVLASYAAVNQMRDARHVALMAQMLVGLFHIFRTIVTSGTPPKKIVEVFEATYSNAKRWSDMYGMLADTYRFTNGNEIAAWVTEAVETNAAVSKYVAAANPHLTSYIALMIRGHASEEAVFRLIDASLPFLHQQEDHTQFGSPETLLTAWGSHSLVLGLLSCLAASGIDATGLDVLDLGCGSGLMSWYLPQPHSLVGIDIDPAMLALAGTRGAYAQLHRYDARVLKHFGDFDLIVSAGVFQYFNADEYEQVFCFAAANLRPGGYLALVAPACSEAVRETCFNTNQNAICDGIVATMTKAAGLSVIENRFTPAVGAHRFLLLRNVE